MSLFSLLIQAYAASVFCKAHFIQTAWLWLLDISGTRNWRLRGCLVPGLSIVEVLKSRRHPLYTQTHMLPSVMEETGARSAQMILAGCRICVVSLLFLTSM